MRRVVLLIFSVAAMSVAASSAGATMRITRDPGGLIVEYAQRFLQARTNGEQVVIDGACLSACTLAIALVPHGQVCATPRAVLGFHAAWRPTSDGGKTTSFVATQAMMELYPADVRDWIGRHGGLTPRMIFLRGRALSAMVPACGATDGVVASFVDRPARAGRELAAVRPGQPRAKLAAHQMRDDGERRRERLGQAGETAEPLHRNFSHPHGGRKGHTLKHAKMVL